MYEQVSKHTDDLNVVTCKQIKVTLGLYVMVYNFCHVSRNLLLVYEK